MNRLEAGSYEGQMLIEGLSITFFIYKDGNLWCAEVQGPDHTDHRYAWTKNEAIEEAYLLAQELINENE